MQRHSDLRHLLLVNLSQVFSPKSCHLRLHIWICYVHQTFISIYFKRQSELYILV